MYDGPDRRDLTVEGALTGLTDEVRRLARLIEGENGRVPINRGIVGVIDDLVHTDAKLDVRLSRVEAQWVRFKWVTVGAAAGGGLLGGVGFDVIKKMVGA